LGKESKERRLHKFAHCPAKFGHHLRHMASGFQNLKNEAAKTNKNII